MYDEDDGLVFSFLLGSFLGLADYYGEILLKSGPAKKIFEDEDHRDVMIELMDGRICYAKDSDLATLDATYRAFKAEYPEQFNEHLERQKAWINTWGKSESLEN